MKRIVPSPEEKKLLDIPFAVLTDINESDLNM